LSFDINNLDLPTIYYKIFSLSEKKVLDCPPLCESCVWTNGTWSSSNSKGDLLLSEEEITMYNISLRCLQCNTNSMMNISMLCEPCSLITDCLFCVYRHKSIITEDVDSKKNLYQCGVNLTCQNYYINNFEKICLAARNGSFYYDYASKKYLKCPEGCTQCVTISPRVNGTMELLCNLCKQKLYINTEGSKIPFIFYFNFNSYFFLIFAVKFY
jgi:hypothetical protein